jgi:hypothetical protein
VPYRRQWDLAGEVIVLGIRRESDTGWTLTRGPLKIYTPTVTDATLTTNPLLIGQQMSGRIGEVIGFQAALSDSEMQRVAAYLTKKWANGYPINLVFEGDSQTAGGAATAGVESSANASLADRNWPAKLQTQLASFADRIAHRNVAVGGSGFTDLNSRAAALDALISPYSHNVLTVWCGTNEAYLNAATTSHNSLRTYCLARRAAGWEKIIVVTAMDRSDVSNETWRSAFNNLIRANYHLYSDGICDVAADPILGVTGAYTNTTYFNDGIHINPTGCTYFAGLMANTLTPILSIL